MTAGELQANQSHYNIVIELAEAGKEKNKQAAIDEIAKYLNGNEEFELEQTVHTTYGFAGKGINMKVLKRTANHNIVVNNCLFINELTFEGCIKLLEYLEYWNEQQSLV